MMALGIVSLGDIAEIGTDPLLNVLDLTAELAEEVIAVSTEAAKRLAEEAEEAKRLAKLAKEAGEAKEAQSSVEQVEEAGQAGEVEPSSAEQADAPMAPEAARGAEASAGQSETRGPDAEPEAAVPGDSQQSQADRSTAPEPS